MNISNFSIKHSIQLFAMIFTMSLAVLPAETQDILSVKGKVTDQYGKAVARAKVSFINKANHETIIDKSNGKGEFEIDHAPCNMFSLIVVPPDKLRLTQAVLENISGDETKHFIIKLKSGFQVSGRVLAENKELKGINVHIIPVYNAHHNHDIADAINGGGYVDTDGAGRFTLTVTPGDKMIEFTNNRYKQFVHKLSQHVSITKDEQIADTILLTRSNN
jgi:hypothetical protein